MHGEVKTWKMTEEERLAYIKKHPIIPTEKPTGVIFSTDSIDYKTVNDRKKENLKGSRLIDRVDKDRLHKLFISGKPLVDIAMELSISETTLNSYIREQRLHEPEKWPYRDRGKRKSK